MENVVTAAIVIFLIVFAALTLSGALIEAQDTMQMAQREAAERWGERARTDLDPVSAQIGGSGDVIDVALRNSGDTRLADFDHWDVFVHYSGVSSSYHAEWLPFAQGAPVLNEWGIAGVYQDAAAGTPEVYEPSVLNPGEEIVLRLRLAQPLSAGSTGLIAVSAANGVGASIQVVNP